VKRVRREELLDYATFGEQRDAFLSEVLRVKAARRIHVGEHLTFLFENAATVRWQIQEMLRAERINDLDAVRAELAVYNALLPEPGELSATLLIEITDHEDIPGRLLAFLGLDECVALIIGDRRVPAQFEAGRSREDKLSAVQYVRFALPPAARAAFAEASEPARLVVDLPNYRNETLITGAVRDSLAADLQGAA
jgi:hypothetical protein